VQLGGRCVQALRTVVCEQVGGGNGTEGKHRSVGSAGHRDACSVVQGNQTNIQANVYLISGWKRKMSRDRGSSENGPRASKRHTLFRGWRVVAGGAAWVGGRGSAQVAQRCRPRGRGRRWWLGRLCMGEPGVVVGRVGWVVGRVCGGGGWGGGVRSAAVWCVRCRGEPAWGQIVAGDAWRAGGCREWVGGIAGVGVAGGAGAGRGRTVDE